MLIEYPATSWDTFLTLAEADPFMLSFVDSGAWTTFTPDQKEMLLRQTAAMIRLCRGITLPTDNEKDLKMGHGYLLLQASRVDMTQYDANDKAIIEEHAGSVGHSFDARLKANSSLGFPPMASQYLSQYGCSGSNNGFSQTYLGRS